MQSNQPWGFYGRQQELAQLRAILQRKRWFFVQIAGRRRIGKTSLIQQAMSQAGRDPTLYIQIPDSDPAGVLTACNDYLQTFGFEQRVGHLQQLAQLIGQLVRQGHVVAIDEFQYFHRRQLFDFCSYLQAEVDKLASDAGNVTGGLIVLGSVISVTGYAMVLWAMTVSPIALVSALRETSVVFAMLISIFWFKEGRLAPAALSTVLVLVGIYFLKV